MVKIDNKEKHRLAAVFFCGANDGNRTCDLLITNLKFTFLKNLVFMRETAWLRGSFCLSVFQNVLKWQFLTIKYRQKYRQKFSNALTMLSCIEGVCFTYRVMVMVGVAWPSLAWIFLGLKSSSAR